MLIFIITNQTMKSDTLQHINDIYLAIEQLRSQVKPLEKTFVEKYGVIIGASLAVAGTIITFFLNRWKEISIKKKDELKKENSIKRKLYADALKYQSSYTKHIRAYYRHKIQVNFLVGKLRIATDEDAKQKMRESITEFKENMGEQNQLFLDEFKNYMAILGEYKFLKNGNTLINEHITSLSNGIGFRQESVDELTTRQQLEDYRTAQIANLNAYWETSVKNPSLIAIEHILHNR